MCIRDSFNTFAAVTAERAFLRGMGGGCQSPVGAHAVIEGTTIRMQAVSFLSDTVQRTEQSGALREPESLGQAVAEALRA